MYKKHVKGALNALSDELVGLGANTFRLDLPRPVGVSKVGVDDFIVLHGKDAKSAFLALDRAPLFLADGISGAQLLNEEIPPLLWVIVDLLPVGLSFLAGKPKIGKSWLVLGLIVAIVSRSKALEYFNMAADEDVEVLYLALEDSKRRMQDRLKKIAPNIGDAANKIHLYFSWRPVEEKGLLALEQFLAEHPKCKAVFIDTFARVRSRSKNANDYYEDYDASAELKRIADRFGIALVAVHHVRKQASNDPFEMISGTTGITGAADTNFVLMRDHKNPDGKLHLTGRDIESQELAIAFYDGVWKVLGNAAPVHFSQLQQNILLAMHDAGTPLGPTELAKKIGRQAGGLTKTLRSMLANDLVEKIGKGKYQPLPEKQPKFTRKHSDARPTESKG